MLLRFLRELAGAAVCGTASALLWLTLGTLWTWGVDVDHDMAFLTGFAAAAIVVPAFALGWVLYLVRTTALQSRARWMLVTTGLTLLGSLVHRAAFFDEAAWPTGFIDGVEFSLFIVGRVTTELDASFLTSPPLASWSMVTGALVAVTVLSALSYRRLRACVARGA